VNFIARTEIIKLAAGRVKEAWRTAGWRLTISFIHSFTSRSYDRSKVSSKASSPHSAI